MNFLNSLEDSARPLLGPNCWALHKMCLLLPKTQTMKNLCIVLHMSVTLFVISEFVEIFSIKSHLDGVILNLKISMQSAVCVLKANSFLFWQQHWIQVLDYVTIADLYERSGPKCIEGKTVANYTKSCRRITYFYWALAFTTIFSLTISFVLNITTMDIFQEFSRNETEPFPHIVSSYVPWDKNQFPGNIILVFWQFLNCCIGACYMAGYDATVLVIMKFFECKLKILRKRCKRLFDVKKCGPIGEKKAYENLKEIHHVHTELLKYYKIFDSVLSPVMFFYVVVCSVMICTSAYQIINEDNFNQQILLAEYLMFQVAQLFMICSQSQAVFNESKEMSKGIIESSWWLADARQRKAVLMLGFQLNKNIVFHAGPFTVINLANFIAILKGAYSYYTLITRK